MQIEPAEQAFAERYAAGEAQVVWTTLVADLETPVSAFLKIAGGRPMSFLLESVEGEVTRGPGLARQWRGGGDQPRGAVQSQQLRSLPGRAARFPARAAGRKPHRIA